MRNLKVALAAACAVVVGWAFTASADDYSYTLLEYLDGAANTYFDTGIKVTETMEFRFRYAMLACTLYHGPFSTYMSENNNTTRIICSNGSTTKVSVNFMTKAGGGSTGFADVTTKAGDVVEGYMNYTRARINTLEQNLTRSSSTVGTADTSTLTLFGRKDGYTDRMRIYSFRAYDNGAITHYYVMARRSDGTLGVYDLVTKEFKPKTGGNDFTAGPAESGLRLAGDTYQYRVFAAATAGGTVAVNGGAARTAEAWQTVGSDLTATVTATPGAGSRFVRWEGDVENLTAAERTSPTLTRTVSAPLALKAVFVYDMPASAYVQNGLVLQWDAIENAGAETHDATATKWIDLSGNGHDLELPAGITFGERSATVSKTTATVGGCDFATNATPLTLEASAKVVSTTATTSFTIISVRNRAVLAIDRRSDGTVSGKEGCYCVAMPSSSNWGNHLMQYYWFLNQSWKTRINVRRSLSVRCGVETGGNAGYPAGAFGPFYEDGVLLPSYGTGWNSGAKAAAPSKEVVIGNVDTVAEANDYRIYDRALTAEEISYNAAIDKARFADEPLPDGFGFDLATKKVTMRVRATCRAQRGSVAVQGGSETEANPAVGDSVTFVATPAEGYRFMHWTGDVGDADETALTSTVFAVTAGYAPHTVTAIFAANEGFDTGDYVQEGLIAQWDGIENAGVGRHDADATTWTELVGGLETAVTGSLSFTNNAAVFDGNTYLHGTFAAAANAIAAGAFTAEFYVRPECYRQYAGLCSFGAPRGNSTRYFTLSGNSGNNGFLGAFEYKQSSWVSSSSSTGVTLYNDNRPILVTAVANGSKYYLYTNGVQVASKSGGSVKNPSSNDFYLGSFNASTAVVGGEFTCHAIRLYNRVLSVGEIRENAAVDMARFPSPADGEAYVLSDRVAALDTGYTPTPKTRVVADYRYADAATVQQRCFSIETTSTGYLTFSHYINGSGGYSWACINGTGNWAAMNPTVAVMGRRTVFDLDSNAARASIRTFGAAGVAITNSITTSRTKNGNWPIAVFAARTGTSTYGNFGRVKLYSLKIFEAGKLVRCYLPWTDGERVGLRDLFTGGVLTSVTGGALIYGRDLTPPEFPNGVNPAELPEGYRYNVEQDCLEAFLNVAGEEGATVSFDNETFETATNGWYTINKPVSAFAKPAAGQSIAAWLGLPSGAQVSEGNTNATFTLTGPMSVTAVSHVPTTLRWRGGASALASDVANWAKDDGSAAALPPVSGDAVHFDKDSPSMTWDLDEVTLASWTQGEDFTGTNTFQTGPVHDGVDSPTHGVLSADGKRRELIVTGDITLNGGRWHQADTPSLAKTHPGWTTGEGVYRLIARAGGNFTVGAKAVVEANLSGFRKEQGPGKTGSRGATHGGSDNGYYAGNLASPETNHYGSVRHPVSQGSGAVYSVGGGALELSADGTFALDGALEADGGSYRYYTGSGGSVFVTAATLTGTGHVYACGYCTEASAGAGGRLAFVVTGPGATFDGFTATLRCYGNSGHSNPGTIYWETPADKEKGGVLEIRGRNSLSVDNRGYYTMLVDTGEDFTFDTVVLTNKVKFAIGPGVTLKANRIISNTTNNRLVLLGGKLVVPDGYALTNVILRNDYYPSSVGTPAGATGTNLLAKGATFTIDRRIDFDGTFRMLSGAKVNHTAAGNSDADLFRADFTAREFVLDSGATVDLTALGYPAAAGPGKPTDDGKTSRGGSHGGLAHDVGSVQAYGSVTRPVTLGSGGLHGIGGGATHIVVSGRSVIDGTIAAGGRAYNCSGAGGSVWLETGTLEGASTGVISADGGKGSDGNEFYAGAGGRVAVTLTEPGADFSQYRGAIRAKGAVANVTVNKVKTYYAAGNGTVYLRKGGERENEGTLIVDGDATCVNDDNYTDITMDVTENTVGHVIITNGGNLRVRKGARLDVRRSFANRSVHHGDRVNGEPGDDTLAAGAVAFVDRTVEATVTGTNAFMRLLADEPGKTIRFGAAADSLAKIDLLGSFDVAGTAETPVFLRGLMDGTPWLLELRGKANLAHADVKDSDATPGDKVAVDDTNVNSGNNQNWGFITITPGETITWNGSRGTAFAAADNWDLGRPPVDTDVIVIPGTASCSPEIAESVALNRLEIATGMSLTLNGFSLTVTNGVNCQGAIVCSGAETLTLDGDVTIKHITAANSTLVLSGTRSRTANLSGQVFNDVVVAGTEPTLSFADGFSANRLTLSSGVARTVEFPSDRTVTVVEFAFSGAVGGEAALTLKGTITGGRWNLNVTGKGAGSGVIVSDSCAVGQRIFAYDPSVEGGSVSGWVFGVSETTWIGGASGNWNDPSKWSGNAVPDANSCVHFTSDATVTLDVDDATAQILDVSGCTVKLKGAKTLTVTSLMEILDGGTLEQAAADNVIHVQGAVFVRSGGVWTHTSNGATDQGFGINASVDGDFTIDAGGKVDAYMKGFNAYKGWATQQQASHGARFNSTSKPCYGSMFRPTDIGSGGGWDNGHAGGRVYLTVKGTLTANGEIDASSMIEAWYPGSGGSILLECGRLAGTGLIRAQGGSRSNADNNAGCGGRVAVYLTEATDLASFEGAGGLIQAYGGINNHTAGSLPIASCGTFYLQAKGVRDGCGTVYVNNGGGITSTGGVDLPVTNRCDDLVKSYRNVTFEVAEGGTIFVTGDVTVRELELGTKARVNLNGHTLTIRSWAHKKGRGWPENWNAKTSPLVYPGSDEAGNPGQIVWEPRPLALIVR